MKKIVLLIGVLVLALSLGACVRIGENDYISFWSAMMKYEPNITVSEYQTGEENRQSAYINGCKISLFSNGEGKLSKVSLTALPSDTAGFYPLARQCVAAASEYSPEQIDGLLDELGISAKKIGHTLGINRREDEWFDFVFTADEAAITLIITSKRLNPTQAPTVTVKLTEKSEAPS